MRMICVYGRTRKSSYIRSKRRKRIQEGRSDQPHLPILLPVQMRTFLHTRPALDEGRRHTCSDIIIII